MTVCSNPFTRGICLHLYEFLLSILWPRNVLKAVSWGSHRPYLVCFLSLRDHCPTLPNAKCLENYCFMCILSSILVVSEGRLKPASITLSCPEVEVRKEVQSVYGVNISRKNLECIIRPMIWRTWRKKTVISKSSKNWHFGKRKIRILGLF